VSKDYLISKIDNNIGVTIILREQDIPEKLKNDVMTALRSSPVVKPIIKSKLIS
jgi:hypothetical protein